MEKGVLLPIFSLPSKYGIGDFGYEAYEFIDILNENNICYWQILPINACDKLPYSPISFFALNEDYISIDKLVEMKLLENVPQKPKSSRITYDNFKEKLYKIAFKNFVPNEEMEKFGKRIRIREYAKYMSEKYGDGEDFYIFLQYILDIQWRELKKYANDKNVKIIGDMPIYPSYDSAEVKYNSANFELENGKMEFVSGAPPDEVTITGQKWGHPLYNFKHIKDENYKYFTQKFYEYLERFDYIRIDHFKAFDMFFKIPVNGDPKDGHYAPGPGAEFFDELTKTVDNDRIIVEDLGNIRQETEDLKNRYNFTGMKLLHYSINLKERKDTMLDSNRVVYTGNHDNNTTVGWYKSLKLMDKINLRIFLRKHGCKNKKINIALMNYAFSLPVRMCIVPVQDILGLDENSRINLPGVEKVDNWSWELIDFEDLRKEIHVMNNNKLIKK